MKINVLSIIFTSKLGKTPALFRRLHDFFGLGGASLMASSTWVLKWPLIIQKILGFSKNSSKEILPDPMISGVDLGCFFLKADRPDIFPGRPLLTSIAMRRGPSWMTKSVSTEPSRQ